MIHQLGSGLGAKSTKYRWKLCFNHAKQKEWWQQSVGDFKCGTTGLFLMVLCTMIFFQHPRCFFFL